MNRFTHLFLVSFRLSENLLDLSAIQRNIQLARSSLMEFSGIFSRFCMIKKEYVMDFLAYSFGLGFPRSLPFSL